MISRLSRPLPPLPKDEQSIVDLLFESEQAFISVSLADTLDRDPEHIMNEDPEQLVASYWESLCRRGDRIREEIQARYMPEDLEYLPGPQQELIREWCDQEPVLGYNAGRYDLRLIRRHFVTKLSEGGHVKVAEKTGSIMLLSTPEFKFFDIMNYLAPGTRYDKWVKTYGSKQQKSWFAYEWLTSAKKVEHQGLVPYWHWYSKQKGAPVLTPSEYFSCCVNSRRRRWRRWRTGWMSGHSWKEWRRCETSLRGSWSWTCSRKGCCRRESR